MFTGQNPAVMGLCIGEIHTIVMSDWLVDLALSVKHVLAHPGEKATGKLMYILYELLIFINFDKLLLINF